MITCSILDSGEAVNQTARRMNRSVEFSEGLHAQMLELGQTVELYTHTGDNHNTSNSFGTATLHSTSSLTSTSKMWNAE